MVLVVPPEGREDHVGRQQPEGDDGGQDLQPRIRNRRRLAGFPAAGLEAPAAGSCGPAPGCEDTAAIVVFP